MIQTNKMQLNESPSFESELTSDAAAYFSFTPIQALDVGVMSVVNIEV